MQLNEGEVHFDSWFITVVKAGRQELEATGHVASKVRKKGAANPMLSQFWSLIYSQTLAEGIVPPTFVCQVN